MLKNTFIYISQLDNHLNLSPWKLESCGFGKYNSLQTEYNIVDTILLNCLLPYWLLCFISMCVSCFVLLSTRHHQR